MVSCVGVEYDLTIASTAGGSVITPGERTFTFSQGIVVSLVAEGEEGYRFVNWTGDVDTIANVNAASTTITMNGDYSITANFEGVEVTFADPNLEAAIRKAVGIPEATIYPEDLEMLTALAADGRNIVDLGGLEYCIDLTHISLSHNPISDILPLSNLSGLTTLYLEGDQISDISALANLTSLTTLKLSNNQIGYIAPLVSLTNLTELDLNDNQVNNISPVESLVNLTRLWLHGNQISDVSPLTDLENLVMLGLMQNPLSDISPLVDNPGLGEGDDVILVNNPLSEESINIYIPELEARGVTVEY